MFSSQLILLLLLLAFATGRREANAYHTLSRVRTRSLEGLTNFKNLSPSCLSKVNECTIILGATVNNGGDANTVILQKDDRTAKVVLAKALGYVMAAGAMFIYSPILIKLIKQGNGDGFAPTTFIFNLIGLSLSMAYPMKKGFPLSTYIEIVWAGLQSVSILGLLCFYQNRFKEYLLGISVLATIFMWFKNKPNIHQKYLNLIQISAMLVGNYANIPQIILTFRTQKASWSGITATLSLVGCLIRIFTTLQLTKDKLVVAGYGLGAVTNGILLLQVLLYK